MDKLIAKHPWPRHMTGATPSDLTYGLLLLQFQAPSSVSAPILSDTSRAIAIVNFFQKASKYNLSQGKISLESLLADHLSLLQMRIDTVKSMNVVAS